LLAEGFSDSGKREIRVRTRRKAVPERRFAASGRVREKNESACKPGSVLDGHSSRPDVAVRLKQPTREQRGPRQCSPIWSCSEWGLPCHATLSSRAVRSYRTVSPLPRIPPPLCCCASFWIRTWPLRAARSTSSPANALPSSKGVTGPFGGLFSVALIRRLTPPRRYLALCPMEPGLSSKCLRTSRPSGRLGGDCTA